MNIQLVLRVGRTNPKTKRQILLPFIWGNAVFSLRAASSLRSLSVTVGSINDPFQACACMACEKRMRSARAWI